MENSAKDITFLYSTSKSNKNYKQWHTHESSCPRIFKSKYYWELSKATRVWAKMILPPAPGAKPFKILNLKKEPIEWYISPGLSKLEEKILKTQLKSFLEHERILPEIQASFKLLKQDTVALLFFCNVTDIKSSIYNNRITALVLLDLNKALDTLNQNLLLEILKSSGIGGANEV